MGFDPYEMEVEDQPGLWRALGERDFVVAAGLIAAGASLDDLILYDGSTLLHDAAQAGDLEMVDFFLAHECAVTREKFDYIDQTPLIRAADCGQVEVVRRLLAAGVKPDAHDESRAGNTAIREAVRGGHAGIVALLLEAGADPTIRGWMGISAVDQAGYEIRGNKEVMGEIRGMLRGR